MFMSLHVPEVMMFRTFEYAVYLCSYRFSVTTTLRLMDSVKSAESTVSAARCVESGELFACLELKDDLSVDSVAGHLVLQSSSVAWLGDGRKEHPDKVCVYSCFKNSFSSFYN